MLGDLTCAVCGRPVARRGTSDGYGHRSRGVVAACDLDADHAALPDWRAAGQLDCAICGGRLAVTADNLLVHEDSGRDREHAPQP